MGEVQLKHRCGFPGFRGKVSLNAGLLATLIVLLGSGPVHRHDESVLFREDFEDGLSERWVERGFPSISRKISFTVALE